MKSEVYKITTLTLRELIELMGLKGKFEIMEVDTIVIRNDDCKISIKMEGE